MLAFPFLPNLHLPPLIFLLSIPQAGSAICLLVPKVPSPDDADPCFVARTGAITWASLVTHQPVNLAIFRRFIRVLRHGTYL